MIGLFPSDHVIADEGSFRQVLSEGIEIAAAGENIVVLGIQPYTRRDRIRLHRSRIAGLGECPPRAAFHGKAERRARRRSSCAREIFSGTAECFCGARETLANALTEHLPKTAALLEKIAADYGTRKFAATFAAVSEVREHQRRLRGARTSVRPKANRTQIFSVSAPISAGTTWARGPRCTSITRPRAPRRTAT